MARHSFIQMSKLSNVKGRISYMVDVLSDLFSFLPEFSGHAGKPLRHIDQQIEHGRQFGSLSAYADLCAAGAPRRLLTLIAEHFTFFHWFLLSRPLQTCLFPHHRLGTPNHRECLQMLFPELFHLPDRRSPDRRYIRRAHIGTCPFRFLLI